MKKRYLIISIFIAVIAIVVCFYFFFHGWCFAYTGDAYLWSNVSVISPRVSGHVSGVYVKNDQYVRKGELLLELESYPYQLVLNVKKSSLAQSQKQFEIVEMKYKNAQLQLQESVEKTKLAKTIYLRYEKLSNEKAVSIQDFELKEQEYESSLQALNEAKETTQYWYDMINTQMYTIDSMKAEVAMAEYNLQQTRIYAISDGFVVNCNVRPGDYTAQGTELFGVIENDDWWVRANYKESEIPEIKAGQKVYIYTGLYPYTCIEGEVEFIGRGSSVTPNKGGIIPYINPTTDWVRLQRRFEVRIKLVNVPKYMNLALGSNVRSFIKL